MASNGKGSRVSRRRGVIVVADMLGHRQANRLFLSKLVKGQGDDTIGLQNGR